MAHSTPAKSTTAISPPAISRSASPSATASAWFWTFPSASAISPKPRPTSAEPGSGSPIVIRDDKYRWIVSPWALGGIIDGSDLAQGGAQYGVGVTSLFGVALADTHLRLGMANQFSYIGGTPFGYSDRFDFKQNVDQFIFKNGFELSGNFTKSLQAYGSITYTNLMRDAFIDAYFTPELGLRWHSEHIAAGIAGFGDFGNRYTGFGGRATLAFLW